MIGRKEGEGDPAAQAAVPESQVKPTEQPTVSIEGAARASRTSLSFDELMAATPPPYRHPTRHIRTNWQLGCGCSARRPRSRCRPVRRHWQTATFVPVVHTGTRRVRADPTGSSRSRQPCDAQRTAESTRLFTAR
ncbi:hypothetical protein GCM10023318_12640 [Nocardia callitridis]|uniref:Uncharacterized protein n=1 Tax=Nocardia callitridis TaxID=648753 RepID=A0ABP9K005_9NOCA